MTLKAKLEAALAARGYRQVPCRSSRYTQWTKDGCNPAFVGTSGALRCGPSASQSVSLQGTPGYTTLLAEGERLLAAQSASTAITTKYA